MGRLPTLGRFFLQQWIPSISKMSPFEALFGRKCNTPVNWDNPIDRALVGPDFVKEMEENVTRQNCSVG